MCIPTPDYSLFVSCGECGGALRHLTGGTYADSEGRAIAKCSKCNKEWQVSVFLREVPTMSALRRARSRQAVSA